MPRDIAFDQVIRILTLLPGFCESFEAELLAEDGLQIVAFLEFEQVGLFLGGSDKIIQHTEEANNALLLTACWRNR